jgi:transcriptional regulator with XRE-family HTH domain
MLVWHYTGMTLADYLKNAGLTQAEFAARIGCIQSDVARYLAGRKPREEVMHAIFKATKGAVRADDFYGLPPAGTRSKVA